MNERFEHATNEPDPFTSPSRKAEQDAFAARGRAIWLGIVVALVLSAVGAWLMFR